MDFLDPNKKRANSIRLFIGYVLMAIAIALGAFILLLRSYGYDLDRKTGQVIQNGLIFLSAQPASANVTLNGESKGSTDTRLTVPSGHYRVVLNRNGYREWRRTLTLEGGSIERLVYPLLFPVKLTPKDVEVYNAVPPLVTSSPDRRWLLVQQPGSVDTFSVIDANDPNKPAVALRLPVGLLTAGPTHSLSLVEWSSDNRHVLLKHAFGGNFEYIMVDRQEPSSSFNLNRTFAGISLPVVVLRDKKYDQFYIHDPGSGLLQRAEFKTKQVTPYLTHVQAFKSYGANTLLYVTALEATPNKVKVQIRDGDNSYSLRNLPATPPYFLDLTKFDGVWYMVVGAQSENRVYIYKDPVAVLRQAGQPAAAPVSVLKLDKPQFVSFSQNARFIAAQNGSSFGVYDAETDKRYFYKVPLPVDPAQKATWMDGHRLTLTQESKVIVFDFDGINQQTLTASDPAYQALFDRDYKYLYTIAPSLGNPGKSALTRTDLEVNN